MQLFIRLTCLFALAAPLSSAASQSAAEKGREIMRAQEQHDEGWRTLRAHGEMILRDATGRSSRRELRVIRGELNTDTRGDRSKIVFMSPADIRGTILLTHTKVEPADNDQWLFLPVIERVKRISSANRTGKFVSSEFTYEDMAGMELEDNDYEWIANQPCPVNGELTCYVVASFPHNPESGYSRRVTWLDTQEYRPFKVEFFNRNGAHEKTLLYSGYRSYGGKFWRANLMKMTNHRTGKRTDLIWHKYEFGIALPNNAFSPQALGLGF